MEQSAFADVIMDESYRKVKEVEAHCTSNACIARLKAEFERQNKKFLKYYNQVGVLKKDVKKSAIDCPDCGAALLWKIVDYERIYHHSVEDKNGEDSIH